MPDTPHYDSKNTSSSVNNTAFKLVLGSTSRYRAELLARLGLSFEQLAPDCDETPLEGESPEELVCRLSQIKALSVLDNLAAKPEDGVDNHTGRTRTNVVIGSDQVADCNGQVLGKPHTTQKAIEQLSMMSGQAVVFRTGLCVATSAGDAPSIDVVNITARFRELSLNEITRYVEREQPLDCAGAFRSEALGITLLSSLEGTDPNALIGLPLIALAMRLRHLGFALP